MYVIPAKMSTVLQSGMCACFAHRAALVAQLPMTQQALALLDARVLLPVIQILQLIDVKLALRLSLLHVDVGQNGLHDGDLSTQQVLLLHGLHDMIYR